MMWAVHAVGLLPHTHWDREWYLSADEFRARLVETMDLVLDILAKDPQWSHFHLDGQTAMVDDYLSVRPEREGEIRALVTEGRLSCGPWVTLVDEFLVSGESIIRNLEDGRARATELGGSTDVGYLPDQFGHVGQMPQILAAAGLEWAIVWRGVPEAIEETSFVWSAPDGSVVNAFYLPFGYGQGGRLTRSGHRFVERLAREVTRLESFLSAHEAALIPAGDDHLPPAPRMTSDVEDAREKGIETTIVSLTGHLAAIDPPLMGWTGELRSAARANLLPNTYSARANQKLERARAEYLIERYAEPLAALVPGFDWPEDELNDAWTLLHLNGAHDSVCGCSTDIVAGHVDERTEAVVATGESIARRALDRLGESARDGTIVFNPSPFERDGIEGLGWEVRAAPPEAPAPVPLAVEGDAIALPFEDRPRRLRLIDQADDGDLYTFSPTGEPKGPVSMSVADGVVTATFATCRVRVSARRGPGEPFLRLTADIDNDEPDHRLVAVVELGSPCEATTAGAPFEIVTRLPRGEGGTSEPPARQWPARGFVHADREGFLSEGVVEYELIDHYSLALTLLRCTGTISRQNPLRERAVRAGPNVATPDAQMIGRTTIPFGVFSGYYDPIEVWERYALPLLVGRARGGDHAPLRGVLLDVDAPALSSVRKRGGVTEARVWNPWPDTLDARVGGEWMSLGPHRIEVVEVVSPAH